MNWTRGSDLKAQLQRLWDRGELLIEALREEKKFPKRLTLKVPSSAEMSKHYVEVKAWVAALRELPNCRVVYRTVDHRLIGKNSIPAECWIDSIDDALTWLGKRSSYKTFCEIVERTRIEQPALLDWLAKNPLSALENAAIWSQLLLVVHWLQQHPRPGIYLREVDLPGIDSKFIESNKHILTQLFDACLPPSAVDNGDSGASRFAERFGFRSERQRVRFRILEEAESIFFGAGDQDISVDVETFANMRPNVERVFITENKTNFLAFPLVANSMVVFGAGYGWDFLENAYWLFGCDIIYWGDIDTHGFAILNQLRSAFPHVRSLMMDETTARHFQHFGVAESKPTDAVGNFLSAEETTFLSMLCENTFGLNFRLEQERIDWSYARERIFGAVSASLNFEVAPRSRVTQCDLRAYFHPTRCEKRVRLNAAENEFALSEDCTSELDAALAQLISRYRATVFSEIPDLIDLSLIEEPAARHDATIAAMQNGAPAIRAPLLVVPTVIAGIPFIIHAEVDLLRLRASSNAGNVYDAYNLRLARNIADHPEISHGLSLFRWAMAMNGYDATGLFVLNPQDPPISVRENVSNAFRTVIEIQGARSVPDEKYCPVGWSKCHGCKFRKNCWSDAIAKMDVAIIPDLDQELAVALHAGGISSAPALLGHFDKQSLADFRYRLGAKATRVGKRAETLRASAQALSSNKPVWNNEVTLPFTDHDVVVIDFEGVSPPMVPQESVYLWGMRAARSETHNYQNAFASVDSPDSDQEAWLKFIELCESAITFSPSLRFVHYHHYETTMMQKYIARYGDPEGSAARIVARCIDLHSVLRGMVSLPVFSYSLKEVERYVGFSRSQESFGGDWSIAKYLQYLDGDNSARSALLQYNSEDIAATAAILDWLLSNSKRVD